MSFYWDDRTMCDALEEMRQASKSKNYSYIDGLIEEVQAMGNRMEAGLQRYGTIERAEAHVATLKADIKVLERAVSNLKSVQSTLQADIG